MKRKLFCIMFASFPIRKYKVPISSAIQVWMIKRIRANERSRRKQRTVRIVSRYHWRQNDVAYDSLRPAQHFLLFNGVVIIFGFFNEADWIEELAMALLAFVNTGARPGAYTGVTRPSSIIFAAKKCGNAQINYIKYAWCSLIISLQMQMQLKRTKNSVIVNTYRLFPVSNCWQCVACHFDRFHSIHFVFSQLNAHCAVHNRVWKFLALERTTKITKRTN